MASSRQPGELQVLDAALREGDGRLPDVREEAAGKRIDSRSFRWSWPLFDSLAAYDACFSLRRFTQMAICALLRTALR
jgi:hypothetical protein